MKKVVSKQQWGELVYTHPNGRFLLRPNPQLLDEEPASEHPLVCNLILTSLCNWACPYCYARDVNAGSTEGLLQTLGVLRASPFLEVVLSGGEPLLVPGDVVTCIGELAGKGVVIDTNGALDPPPGLLRLLVDGAASLRVSVDAPDARGEADYRRARKLRSERAEKRDFDAKIDRIRKLVDAGVCVSVQTVVHGANTSRLTDLGNLLVTLGTRHWFLQPMLVFGHAHGGRASVRARDFDRSCSALRSTFTDDLEIHEKRDVRSNSVFLCDRDGIVYTQAEHSGDKVRVGHISEPQDFFTYVSRTDHTRRYATLDEDPETGSDSDGR